MKDTVHTDYLKSLESKRSLPELPWSQRTVVIVGSDGESNVGAMTARNVAIADGKVIEGDKHSFAWSGYLDAVKQATDLVVCAASVHLDWIENTDYSEIDTVVHNSLVVPMWCVAEFAKANMRHNHRKHIVLVGSMAHRQVLNGSSAYCASKAGLAHFARCAAWELTPKGFTIGVVHPGNIEGTRMTEETIEGIAEYRNLDLDDARQYWASTKLTETWLTPDQVASEIMFLLTSNPHKSGAQVEMGGGMR